MNFLINVDKSEYDLVYNLVCDNSNFPCHVSINLLNLCFLFPNAMDIKWSDMSIVQYPLLHYAQMCHLDNLYKLPFH